MGIGALDDQRISWQVAHEALSQLARARAAADAEEGRWLLAAERAAVHVHLGYGSFSEYIERLFGYQPRSLQERLRVAEALEGLPALGRALSSGELSWSAVRELTRVAVRDTEQEWLDFARGKTLRQLEQVLAQRRSGDSPASPPDLSAQRHTLRFDVAGETLALFREAMSELRRRAGTAIDDDCALLELARCVLGGPSQEGRASYQIVLEVCPECGNGQQQAAGSLVPVGPHAVSLAQCDAQHIGAIPGPGSAPANDLEPGEGRDGRASISDPATIPQDDDHVGAQLRSSSSAANQNAHVDASAIQDSAPVGARGRSSNSPANQNAHVDAFAAIEQGAATRRAPASSSQTNGPAGPARVLSRATQTIPPALRRAARLRDQHRCQVPGCSNERCRRASHRAPLRRWTPLASESRVRLRSASPCDPSRPAYSRAQRARRDPRPPCRRH
jgi:hypothetical protein